MHDLGIRHASTTAHRMEAPVGASGVRILATLFSALDIHGAKAGRLSLRISGH